jgi:protein-S-isoprenylcysteine O-methyltransferase Ste14
MERLYVTAHGNPRHLTTASAPAADGPVRGKWRTFAHARPRYQAASLEIAPQIFIPRKRKSVYEPAVTLSPRLVLFTIVATLAYLGGAILGAGGFALFFSHPALVALAVVFFVMSAVALFSEGNLSPGVREDRANRWVIVALGLIGIVAAYLPAYTDRKGFWTLDGETIRWLGVVLFAAGGVLRLWPVFVLGRRFSGLVAIQPGHELVTTGVFRVIRNPSYLGLLVNSLGWALAFRAGVGVLLTALLVPPLLARIRAEERLLRTQFGGEYDAYCNRTWRLVPGIY